jgi:hypothetical protein
MGWKARVHCWVGNDRLETYTAQNLSMASALTFHSDNAEITCYFHQSDPLRLSSVCERSSADDAFEIEDVDSSVRVSLADIEEHLNTLTKRKLKTLPDRSSYFFRRTRRSSRWTQCSNGRVSGPLTSMPKITNQPSVMALGKMLAPFARLLFTTKTEQ